MLGDFDGEPNPIPERLVMGNVVCSLKTLEIPLPD
jgi:hypothetical protein